MCNKCMKMSGVIVLVLGLVFLSVDLGFFNFWGINWWTAVFVLAGLAKMGCSKCPDCQAMHGKMGKK